MNESRTIEDSYLFGHSLATLESDIEVHPMVKFAQLNLQAVQIQNLSDIGAKKRVIYLASVYNEKEGDVEKIANMEAGVFSKLYNGFKSFFKKVFEFIKKLLFFWKKQDTDKEVEKKDVEAALKENEYFLAYMYIRQTLGSTDTFAETREFLRKVGEGDLKAKPKTILNKSEIEKTDEYKNIIDRLTPDKKTMFIFNKKIPVHASIAPLGIKIKNVEIENEFMNTEYMITCVIIIRDTNDNVIGLYPLVATFEAKNKRDIMIKQVEQKIPAFELSNKYLIKELETDLKSIEKIEKITKNLENDEEGTPLAKALKELGYEIKIKDILTYYTMILKTIMKTSKGISDNLAALKKI